jgi:hypothetical protein
VFFAHEFGHSFTAWALGWKGNPLELDYAQPTLVVLLVQFGINQNVDEAAIFAAGQGVHAAIIAAAGAVLGNALVSYPVSRVAYARAKRHGQRGWAMFAYWICVASVGNFIDYVPVRTFTLEGDMGSLQRGLGWSPWTVLIVLGIPTLAAVLYFFVRIEPATLRWLFPRSWAKRAVLAVLTAFMIFGFYGAAGWSEGGPVSHAMSVISVCVLFPGMALFGALFMSRRSSQDRANDLGQRAP